MKNSILNDLASMDIFFSEIFEESGQNPFPFVCDQMDMSIFESNNAKITQFFKHIETNIDNFLALVNAEPELSNNDEIKDLISNLKARNDEIKKNKKNFKKKDFSFLQFYIELKKIQNQLGISVPSNEINILAFGEKELDIENLKKKILEYAKKRQEFLNDSNKLYRKTKQYEKEIEKKQEQSKIIKTEKIKEKTQKEIKEKKEQKEKEQEVKEKVVDESKKNKTRVKNIKTEISIEM